MIRLDGVSFSYLGGRPALREVDFRIGPGELAVLTGPSGCGKTTAARVINGLAGGFFPGTLTGEVRISGRDAASLAPWERAAAVGSLFQDPAGQFVAETVLGELAFGCECLGMARDEIVRRAGSAAALFSLAGSLALPPAALSGGERQRLAAASVWAAGPGVLVLDEPTANLDACGVEVLAEAVALVKASGRAVVVAEHRLGWLAGLADVCLYFRDGRLERSMALSELMALEPRELREMGLRDPRPDVRFRAGEGSAVGRDRDGSPDPGSPEGEGAASCIGTAPELGADPDHVAAAGSGTASCRRTVPERGAEPGQGGAAGGGTASWVGTVSERGAAPGAGDAASRAEGPCRGLAAEELGLRRHREEIFRDFTMELEPGEIKALTGPNGAGKTSLGRILCGLGRESAGRVLWAGRPLRPARRQRAASMVAAEPQGQLLGDTAENELRLSGADGKAAKALLEELGLGEVSGRHPFTLSGGQKQKLVLASASLRPQPALFLDEPTSGLDLRNMSLVASFLRRLADSGRALIVATHDTELIGECRAPSVFLPRRA
ncbi:MAG: ABC transporter ATP-binding protein [Deltaproteobacteria bacterium]|nr:ABC transporter ATP-binding protein [Deltaproteobacteria bacterium]